MSARNAREIRREFALQTFGAVTSMGCFPQPVAWSLERVWRFVAVNTSWTQCRRTENWIGPQNSPGCVS